MPLTNQLIDLRFPRFSPDGSQLAYAAALADTTATTPSRPARAWRWPWEIAPADAHGVPMDVWLVPVQGGETAKVTNFGEDEPVPAWSPNGRELAIMATGGFYRVVVWDGATRRIGAGAFGGQVDWR